VQQHLRFSYDSASHSANTYDANGNTLSDPSGKSYAWDFENRLTQAVVPGTGTTTFRYDPFGRRIQKSGPLGTTNYSYDGGNILETMDQNGNFQSRYVGTLNADEPLAAVISGATGYYEQDGINSVTSLSSSSGALTNTYSYDSYGRVTGTTGTIANPFQYTAREVDSETSLYYYRARQYDPRVGRFMSEDPEGFDASTNFYAYVDNDPANWTDPTGLDKVQACCRPLRKAKPFLMIWHHCYIKISDSSGSHTWGILPDSQGNQIPVKDDPRNSGGKCKDVPGGSQCGDAEKLKKGLDDDASSQSCPSCGANYHNWWWRFAGYNSNTFVYNMLSGAGFAPPPEPRSPGYNPAPGGWYP
jgi:RHS repeat-associated protein